MDNYLAVTENCICLSHIFIFSNCNKHILTSNIGDRNAVSIKGKQNRIWNYGLAKKDP